LDDDRMTDLVESIKENGVLSPVLVRQDVEDSYEMISGHRRMHAAQLVGLEVIPAIIRDMTDDEAVVYMVDSNIQREELLPSEKAFAYKMRMDAINRQGKRTDRCVASKIMCWSCHAGIGDRDIESIQHKQKLQEESNFIRE